MNAISLAFKYKVFLSSIKRRNTGIFWNIHATLITSVGWEEIIFFHGLQKRFKRFYADIAWKKIQRMLCRFCLQKVCAKFKGFYSQGLNPFWVRTVWYLIDLYIWYHTVRTQNGLSPCGFMKILLAERFKGFCADIVNHRKQSPLQIADRVMTSEYVRWSIKVSTINLVLFVGLWFFCLKTEDLYLKASILYSVVQAL